MFRIACIVLLSILTIIRTYYKIRFRAINLIPFTKDEGVALGLARALLGIPLLASTFLFCFIPGAAPWMVLELPFWIRVCGVAAGVCSLGALVWVHEALGSNFTTTIGRAEGNAAPRERPQLVTTGPYHFVRHPMYATYFVFFLSIFFITSNWVIAISGLGIIVSLMILRLPREEALLVEQFGDAYTEYMRTTSKFVPRPKAASSVRFSDD